MFNTQVLILFHIGFPFCKVVRSVHEGRLFYYIQIYVIDDISISRNTFYKNWYRGTDPVLDMVDLHGMCVKRVGYTDMRSITKHWRYEDRRTLS